MHADDKKPCVDALRLSDSQRRELLMKLDRRSQAHRGGDARYEDRLPYTASGVVVTLHHPGGSVMSYLVQPRNLSRNGVGFLHGNFVYVDSRCQVSLQRPDGKHETIPGKVVRCQHVEGLVHEIGVRFEYAIDLGEFLRDYTQPVDAPAESVELPKLSGSVLYVEESVSDRELLKFHLSNLGLETRACGDGLEALELVREGRFDLIVVGVDLPGLTGPELIDAIRSEGYEGPAIILTADDSEVVRRQAEAAGCNAVYSKPYTLPQVVDWMTVHLGHMPEADPAGDDECLFSTEWNNPQLRPLIVDFIDRMTAQADELAAALTSGQDPVLIQKMSLELKGSAGGYGFPSVSEVSSEIYRLSMDGASAESLDAKCRELIGLCQRAGRARDSS